MNIINKDLKSYAKWLKEQNLAVNTIALYSQVMKSYQNKALSTNNLIKEFKQGLKTHEFSYLILKREILKSYTKFQKITIDWEKISKIIPAVQKKFFITLNETELELLKQARFEKSQSIRQRNNLILDFLFYTGVRVSELVNLKHSDWTDNSLKILGKGNKIRYIFLPPFLTYLINPYAKDYLFLNCRSKKITREYIAQLIKERTILAGIKKHITPHTFRRSFATLLNNRKCNLTTIQKLLGHSQITTTAQYIHNSYEELYQDYSKLWNR